MTKKQIKEWILDWIYSNYGPQEAEDPCYDIDSLASYLAKKVKSSCKLD